MKTLRTLAQSVLWVCVWIFGCEAFPSDHFNLESGIPTTLEDIEPIERGTLEFQAFGKFLRFQRGRTFGHLEPRLAFGALDNAQLEIAAPLLLGRGAPDGNGDIQVSLLRKLRDDTPKGPRPGVAIEADVTLPSGMERRGFKNRLDAGLTALLKKEIAGQHVHLNAGFDWTRDESDEESLRRIAWTIAAGHHTALTPALVLVSDIVWRQADETDSRAVWLLESGLRGQITRKLIGAIGIGAGLHRGADTPALTVTAGFQLGLR